MYFIHDSLDSANEFVKWYQSIYSVARQNFSHYSEGPPILTSMNVGNAPSFKETSPFLTRELEYLSVMRNNFQGGDTISIQPGDMVVDKLKFFREFMMKYHSILWTIFGDGRHPLFADRRIIYNELNHNRNIGDEVNDTRQRVSRMWSFWSTMDVAHLYANMVDNWGIHITQAACNRWFVTPHSFYVVAERNIDPIVQRLFEHVKKIKTSFVRFEEDDAA